ncbi:MAG TPA: PQQ-dependent sugar dehydrogenase [Croceibacterium sp.]|nr:PQQ-dependent sugar dehydrogenase [Croceibacterium sp.]
MRIPTIALSLPLLAAASCGSAQSGDSAPAASASNPAPAETRGPFAIAALGTFEEPWALAIEPGTNRIFITEKAGTLKVVDPATGKSAPVSGTPQVSYGGQGGFADVAFAPDYAASHTIYLSWVKADESGKRYGVVGRGTLDCADMAACAVNGLTEIWRQSPALETFGQFAVRLAFAPDGKHLFVASGDLAKGDPAQDISNNLGAIVRLNLDGTPAAGNPLAGKGNADIWTYGHRNPLGLKFDASGQLWDVEHGPAGGDEINKLVPGDNYGWPVVSNGDNYNGTPIPRHPTRPEFHAPAISWNPVIAPGDMIFYSGKLWPEWKGNAIVAGLKTQALVRVKLSGDKGTEEARYDMGKRMRGLAEAPDGSIYAIEDGKGGRLLRLTPAK